MGFGFVCLLTLPVSLWMRGQLLPCVINLQLRNLHSRPLMLVTALSLHRLCRTSLLSAWPSTTQTRPPASGMLSVSLSVACMNLIICLQGFAADLQPCSGNPCSLCTQLSLSPPPAPIWMPSSHLNKKARCAGSTCARKHGSAECLRKGHQEALGKLFRG